MRQILQFRDEMVNTRGARLFLALPSSEVGMPADVGSRLSVLQKAAFGGETDPQYDEGNSSIFRQSSSPVCGS